jgi:PTH1 family peptidyl-tRNA hydrolase
MNDSPWLIVGLGNPGSKYQNTRHNVGALAIEHIQPLSFFSAKKKFHARVSESTLNSKKVVYLLPDTYMNESGLAVSAAVNFYKVPLSQVVVLHDEIDIDFSTLRLKLGGGDNGHNGLKNIRLKLGSGDFMRVRIGVSRPTGFIDPADYVLSNFTKSESSALPEIFDRVQGALQVLVQDGLDVAQSRFNQ